MITLSVCVGSSCHLKGSYDVTGAIRDEIKKRGLEDKIDFKAAFCLGHCDSDGVTIKVNEKIITGIKPSNVSDIFDSEIMPLL